MSATTPDTAPALTVADITLSDRPLVVCDIDEVVLEFVSPLDAFLRVNGLTILPRSFRLHGNVVGIETGNPASDETVSAMLSAFFAEHDRWQYPAEGAVDAVKAIGKVADIVFLSAVAPRHAAMRTALLSRLGLDHPLLTIEGEKGPTVAALHGERDLPLAFIDDIARNLQSVRTHLPSCLLVNMIANPAFRAMAPHPGDDVVVVSGWPDATTVILDHIRLPTRAAKSA